MRRPVDPIWSLLLLAALFLSALVIVTELGIWAMLLEFLALAALAIVTKIGKRLS